MSSFALRKYTLDAAITYEKPSALSAPTEILELGSLSNKDIFTTEDSIMTQNPASQSPKTPISNFQAEK